MIDRRARAEWLSNYRRWMKSPTSCSRGMPDEGRLVTYFLQFGGPRGAIKIGKATNLRMRVIAHQCSCPVPLVCIGYFLGDCEDALHEFFDPLCFGGEWFTFDPLILEAIHILATPCFVARPLSSPAKSRRQRQQMVAADLLDPYEADEDRSVRALRLYLNQPTNRKFRRRSVMDNAVVFEKARLEALIRAQGPHRDANADDEPVALASALAAVPRRGEGRC